MRILVTGSRDWSDSLRIGNVLAEYHDADDPPTLVSGACPTGADREAETAARFLTWEVERHPADWETHGRKAGPIRNAEMVKLGADVCLAFIGPCTSPRCNLEGEHASHGASGYADLAASAGIPVRRFLA